MEIRHVHCPVDAALGGEPIDQEVPIVERDFVPDERDREAYRKAGAQPLEMHASPGSGGLSWVQAQSKEEWPLATFDGGAPEKQTQPPQTTARSRRQRPAAGPRRSDPAPIRDLVAPELIAQPEPHVEPEPVKVEEPERIEPPVKHQPLDQIRAPSQQFCDLTGLEVEHATDDNSVVTSRDRFFRIGMNGERIPVHPNAAFHLYVKAVANQPLVDERSPKPFVAPGNEKLSFRERRAARAQERSADLIRAGGPEWTAIDLDRKIGAGPDRFLAVGPGGLFFVQIEHYGKRTVVIDGDNMLANHVRADFIPQVREYAGYCSRALTRAARHEQPIPVHPILVLSGKVPVVGMHKQPKGVTIVYARDLARTLQGMGHRISPETVRKLQALAEHQRTWL